MALPGAAQSERNPARGALAGDGAGGADDCGGVCSLDGAGARLCVFALAVLASDGLPGACGGRDVAGTLPVTVDNRFSSGGARRGYRVAGADFVVRDGAARTILSVLCVRNGGGSFSLGRVGTAAAAVALLEMEAYAVQAGLEPVVDRWLRVVHLPRLGMSVRELDPQQLFMTSVYLIVLGFLLGYMAENQKKVRAERAVIMRVLSSTRVEAGLTGTMQQLLGEVMSIYGASRVLSASQEANSYRVFLAEVTRGVEGGEALRWREALPESEKVYLFESPAAAIYASRTSKGFRTVLLDRDGARLREVGTGFLGALERVEKFDAMVSVALAFGTEWSGRVFLFDPQMMGAPEEELRFLQEFAQQVGPAIYNVYLMRRLRERAGALERARFAR